MLQKLLSGRDLLCRQAQPIQVRKLMGIVLFQVLQGNLNEYLMLNLSRSINL